MKGYQYLENDFFELCKTRKVNRFPMLLYIYLRGLYCRFQKPIFFWEDKETLKHLGISQPTLRKAREILQQRGLLLYVVGNGREHPTEYTLLGTALLPEIKVKERDAKGERNLHLSPSNVSPSIYTSYEQVKNRVGKPFKEKRWVDRGGDTDKIINDFLGRSK